MKGRRRILVLAAIDILLVGCLTAAIVFNAQPINHQLHAWKLLPEPERLTELYFTDHTKLPAKYTPGETQTVAFTVHNLEYRTTDYTFRVIQSSDDGTQNTQLATGNLTLQQNQTSKQTVAIILTDLGPRSRVNIILSSGESINYLVKREG